jgi:hypothetical protein
MEVTSLVAGLLLFWPASLLLFLIGFGMVAFAVVLVSSAVILFGIFLYGIYSILRDLGLLDAVFQKLGNLTNYIGSHIGRNIQNSFVVKDLSSWDEKSPALFICHPHGLYGLTWFLHFSTSLTAWPFQRRPVLAVHSVFFKIPLLRELFLYHNCIEAKETEIKKALGEGKSVALLVGGVEELLLTQTGSLKLVLDKRNGFVRIAQEMKVPLIPVVSPNENDLFTLLETPWTQWIQESLYKQFHLSLPIPSWSSLKGWMSLTRDAFAKPILTYVLEPVVSDGSSFEELKSAYKQRLLDFSTQSKIPIQVAK